MTTNQHEGYPEMVPLGEQIFGRPSKLMVTFNDLLLALSVTVPDVEVPRVALNTN